MKLFCLCLFIFSFSTWGLASSSPWLAYGDLRGHIAPCGCDPLTDLGGIRRLAAFIGEAKKRHKSLLVLDLGNQVMVEKPIKSEAILQGLQEIDPTASLFNELEFRYGLPTANNKSNQYLLSHFKPQAPLRRKIKQVVQNSMYVIFGYVHKKIPQTFTWSPELAQRLQNLREKNADKISVLLFSGPTEVLEKIQQASIFTLIVSSNPLPFSSQPSQEEKEEPGRLRRFKNFFMIPSFGQGILLGGGLESDPLVCGFMNPIEDRPLIGKACPPYHWLTRRYEDINVLAPIMASYRKGVRGIFEKQVAVRKNNLAKSPYAGAQTCKVCHSRAYDIWKGSKHSRALETLKKKVVHRDGECVGCHVVGFTKFGGYVDEEHSPHFAGVQCENCHGPRKNHVANPLIKGPKHQNLPKNCEKCHHSPHSPSFQYSQYWNSIEHR